MSVRPSVCIKHKCIQSCFVALFEHVQRCMHTGELQESEICFNIASTHSTSIYDVCRHLYDTTNSLDTCRHEHMYRT